jgi:hypothetical protein
MLATLALTYALVLRRARQVRAARAAESVVVSVLRRLAAGLTFGIAVLWAACAEADELHLIPRPARVAVVPDCRGPALRDGLTVPADLDPGARELVDERWRALGISMLRSAPGPTVAVRVEGGPAEAYRLTVTARSVRIVASDGDGVIHAFATLAQLAQPTHDGYELPCVEISDAPALRWRILSDDVSRGPLPTMRYFKERIRTIAAFKMNGYSPYIEHVIVDPKHPLPAPLDGLTPAELRELAAYAARFHVALVPEQQTFAHMHGTLRWERYAGLAELPHGYLLSPAIPESETYVRDAISTILAAVPHPPFFHIGSDEPSDLGRGRSRELVDAQGEGAVYARHVAETARFVMRSGARPLVWDDALSRHPELFASLPKELVFVNWHYGTEPTYVPYIKRIADGGFEQLVSPGANNWNEIFPDLDVALGNEGRFISEGKNARVLGLFQTVWHDDGETLFEATWYPVLYSAANAWEESAVPAERYAADFPAAFFGSDDARYAGDIAALAEARTLLHRSGEADSGDYLFWSDPFDPLFRARAGSRIDLVAVRLASERAIEHLRMNAPPLHANAARVMYLAARRYDTLARGMQIAAEARGYYDDALAHADGKHDALVYRGLFVAKYLFWEMRDTYFELEALMRDAWRYENRESHLASVLERYHIAAARAIDRADRINRETYERYVRHQPLEPFDEALGLPGASP